MGDQDQEMKREMKRRGKTGGQKEMKKRTYQTTSTNAPPRKSHSLVDLDYPSSAQHTVPSRIDTIDCCQELCQSKVSHLQWSRLVVLSRVCSSALVQLTETWRLTVYDLEISLWSLHRFCSPPAIASRWDYAVMSPTGNQSLYALLAREPADWPGCSL